MEKSIDILINRIRSVLGENEMHMLLYGSAVLDDFRLGWSDIDILCLTEHDFTELFHSPLLLSSRGLLVPLHFLP